MGRRPSEAEAAAAELGDFLGLIRSEVETTSKAILVHLDDAEERLRALYPSDVEVEVDGQETE